MRKKTFWLDHEDRSTHLQVHMDPKSLVSKRVSVLWAKGKRYSGVVKDYDAEQGKHMVLYDDGSKKWWVLFLPALEVLEPLL